MTLRWPDTLPLPQADTIQIGGPTYIRIVDVLTGPTRSRLDHRNATGTWEFTVWLTANEAALFEDWYNLVVALHDGEWYAPWIGHAAVVAFADEYEERPLGTGWRVSGMVVQTRTDQSICDEHINLIFGGLIRDEMPFPADVFEADLTSTNIYQDDYPLSLIAAEPC